MIIVGVVLLSILIPLILMTLFLSYEYKWIPFAIALVILLLFVIAAFASAAMGRVAMRVRQFAERNGFVYVAVRPNPLYGGMIFSDRIGSDRIARNIVCATESGTIPFELGQYSYTTGSNDDTTLHEWVYICVKMKRNLPHIVLDAKANDSHVFGVDTGSDLPLSFTRDQIVHLEGDFDTHFTLYAPKEYEDDALYVFTPDVMALLIDEAWQFDAEIVDDDVYFYLQNEKGITMDNPMLMQKLMDIVMTLGSKLQSGTQYYVDDHTTVAAANTSNAPVVSQQGRHLQTSWFTTSRIVVIIFVIVWAIIVISGSLWRNN